MGCFLCGWIGIRSRLRARSGCGKTVHWTLFLHAPVRIPFNPNKTKTDTGWCLFLFWLPNRDSVSPAGSVRVRENRPLDAFLTRTRSNPFQFQQNKTGIPNGIPVFFGCRIGIRTPTNRVRVCRATVTQFGNVLRTDNSIALSGSFVKRILKKIENFLSVSCDRVKIFPPPFTSAHKCGKIFSY